MKKVITSDKIYIDQSEILGAGRGVYARCDIRKNEIIERCPVIEVPKHDMANLKESILVTYFFYLGKRKDKLIIALGFGSIYNHSRQPNAVFKAKFRQKILEFIASKAIKKDEEITVNYNYSDQSNITPLWFE